MNGKALPTQTRQMSAPPGLGFEWKAEIGAGLMRFEGFDGCTADAPATEGWTKSWLPALVHLVRIGGHPDHARAAAIRATLESLREPTLPGSALWPNRTCRPCRSS